MNGVRAFWISAGLIAFVGYMALAMGLGYDLTPFIGGLFWAAVGMAALGFAAVLLKRPRFARWCWGFTASVIVGVLLWDEYQRSEDRKKQPDITRLANENRLAHALARVPCDNGDIAVLSRPEMLDGSQAMEIAIVPADRSKSGETIAFENGRRSDPESDRGIRYYRETRHTECHSAEYASLDAMMVPLLAHYEIEHRKYAATRTPAAPH